MPNMYEKTSSGQGGSKPKQKIASSLKNKEWADSSARYYRSTVKIAIPRQEALELYRLANGELEESDYLYITNPLNSPRKELQGFPGRLANYDIISPNLNLILGEKARRFFPPIVVAKNTDYHIRALEEQKRLTVQELQKRFINELVSMHIPLEGEEVKMELEEIAKKVKNLPDELSNQAQDVLEYIMDYNDLPRHLRKGFYDWCCLAMVYSYKDVYKNKTTYEIISAIHLSYLCAPKNDFIEDGEAVKADHIFSINELHDRFQDEETFKDDLEEFIDQYGNDQPETSNINTGYQYGMTDLIGLQREMFSNLFGRLPEEVYASGCKVEHVMWRSFAKVGKLVTQDLWGNKMTIEVSDDYKPLPTDDITWEWVDEIWENYFIAEKIWIGARPVPIQRGSYNDPHKAKLLYNGRNYFARHTRPTSLVRKGKNYQKSVNIIKYKAEQTLAKNLDKIILFPLGLIPKKEGWDEDKLMYFVRAHSFLFFDDTRTNASAMVQAMKDLDVSSYDQLLMSYQLVETVKREWDEVCGINPQRKGQVSASAGKGVTQEATSRSYTMSETLYLQYEEFERTEYTGMIELSKYAFIDGIQAHFIKQDGTRAFLNLHDPDSFINSDIALFVKNGGRENEKLEQLRAETHAFAQNQVDPKMIAGIIEAENFGKLHNIMDEIDARNEARRQQEMQSQQELQASKERIANQASEFDYYSTDLESYTNIQVALIKEGMQVADQMRQIEGGKTDVTGELYNNLRGELEKNNIELLKNATKIKDINSRERMNTQNNKTKLANPVSGEKRK